MTVWRIGLAIDVLVAGMASTGTVAGADVVDEAAQEVPTCTVDFGEGRRFEVEMAATQEERVRGLAKRTDEAGMAFVWPIPGRREFWTVDTPLSLRLLWIDANGTVAGTVDMEPMSEKVHRSPMRSRMAIELPRTWMEAQPVERGDRIRSTTCGAY